MITIYYYECRDHDYDNERRNTKIFRPSYRIYLSVAPILYPSLNLSIYSSIQYYLSESAVLRLSSFVVFLYSVLTVRFYILLSIYYLPCDRNGLRLRRRKKQTRATWRSLWPVLIFVFPHLHVLVCAGKGMAATQSRRKKEQQTVRVFKQGVFSFFLLYTLRRNR